MHLKMVKWLEFIEGQNLWDGCRIDHEKQLFFQENAGCMIQLKYFNQPWGAESSPENELWEIMHFRYGGNT